VEKLVHEHGPVTIGALLADLASDPEAETMRPLLDRIQAVHALDPDPPEADLTSVLRQIESAELSEQLRQITQSGSLSESDYEQIRAIYARQAELKPAGSAA
jgi:hypothetical protein